MLKVAARLRAGEAVTDGEFDQVFVPDVEAISFRHWTPVWVARRAAELLVHAGATEILDVGAGPGKFCIVGALTTAARFAGVEQRGGLVEQARQAAGKLGAKHDLSDIETTWAEIDSRMHDVKFSVYSGAWPASQGPMCGFCPVKQCEFNKTK